MVRLNNNRKFKYFAVALCLIKRRTQIMKCRRYQVHPVYVARRTHGEYVTLLSRLEEYPLKFSEYCRMSQEQFISILKTIHDDIKPKYNLYRTDYISSKEKLFFTLRFLATGASFADLSIRFLMGRTTVRILYH